MSTHTLGLKKELEQRGFLHQYTDEKVFELFEQGGKNFYFGVDLSADSMTIGNFVALMMCLRVMMRGNKAYLLVGGATSTIGNPSGKDKERPILSDEQLAHNQKKIGEQFRTLCAHVSELSGATLDFEIVNNKDFFADMNALDYLKEVGRYITVNRMLGKDIVRKRVNDPDKSISYAEFSYMLIMGYDFYHLYKHHDVIMEVGGSDERDGIITGLELIHKKAGGQGYGITNKLITDSNGKKFGKSEGNAIWLSPEKNPPYTAYNYFINSADDDIEKYLNLLTLLSDQEIKDIITQHNEQPHLRYGQERLAYLVTQIVFGTAHADQARLVRNTLFQTSKPSTELREKTKEVAIATGVALGATKTNQTELRITEALVLSGLCESNAEAKKAIKSNAITLNDSKVTDISYILSGNDRIHEHLLLLKKGKKTYKALVR